MTEQNPGEDGNASSAPNQSDKFQTVVSRSIALVVILVLAFVVYGDIQAISHGGIDDKWHPVQIMELYYATAVALLLIILFKSTDGPIDVDMKVIHLKGSSGPIIMWVITFMSLCLGMKILGMTN